MTENEGKKIRTRLMSLLAGAHAPYSNFRVASAVVDQDGSIHYGVNVENQSFPVGTCAESAAIAAMRTAGGQNIRAIYLLSDPNVNVLPCGACRQRILEFGEKHTKVITFSSDGEETTYLLDELLPHAFKLR